MVGGRRGGGALRLRAAAALVGVAAAGAAGSATSPGPATKQANSLQDFGYFWGRSPNDGHFGPGVWPELAAFANHTTTAIVMNGGPNASAMAHNDILAIEQLRARNMSAILGTPGNVLTLAQRSLQPDYEQRWAEYWRLVKPHSSAVLAFYPFDVSQYRCIWVAFFSRVPAISLRTGADRGGARRLRYMRQAHPLNRAHRPERPKDPNRRCRHAVERAGDRGGHLRPSEGGGLGGVRALLRPLSHPHPTLTCPHWRLQAS